MSSYRKIWWCYTALMGGAAALAAFLLQSELQIVGTSLDSGPFFSFELIPMLGFCVALATLYLPVLFLSDLLFKKSNPAALISVVGFSLLLATVLLLRKHFEFGPDLLSRGWNVYLYTLVMGVCCLFGWQRSRS